MVKAEGPCVLVIEDQEEIQLSAKFLLRKLFPVIDVCNMPAIGMEKLNQREYDVILLDMNFSRGKTAGEEGLFWLKKLMQARPETVIVLMTAFGDIELAIKSIKNGAFDFILKPWNNTKFCETMSEALRYSRTRRELKNDSAPVGDCIGSSASWLDVMQKARRVATTDVAVMLLGDSGSGRRTIASFIHQSGNRSQGPLLHFDLMTIQEDQFECELFGGLESSGKSAALSGGLLQKAHEGTLVIHDLHLLAPAAQLQLLQWIRERKVKISGNELSLDHSVRIVATSSPNLPLMVTKGQFNKELYYVLATVEIVLPSLRDRGNDQVELASFFLGVFREKYQRGDLKYSETAVSAIAKYRWPGNVRELKQAVERAVILSTDLELEPEDIIVAESGGSAETEEHLMSLEEVEMNMIKRALTKHGGVISHAANELGLTRASLYRRLEKYGL